MNTWDADIRITQSLAHDVVSLQFASYASEVPQILGEGWDNLCIVYPDGMVFRLPRRKSAVPLIEVEWSVLPLLAPQIPVPIPVPELKGEPTSAYPFPFLGCRLLAGTTGDQEPFAEAVLAAQQLGATLRVLHGLDPLSLHLPADHLHRKDPARILERFEARWKHLPNSERERWGEPLAEWVRKTALDVQPTSFETVVHGDLYPRHLLVHQGKLSGIIDWGDVHVGHPSMDLSVMYTGFDEDCWPAFLSAYGRKVAEEDLLLARLRASMYGTALLAYGLDTGDEAITNCGRSILDRLIP